MICERLLEDKGVYGDISVDEFHMDVVALDNDVLTLDLPACARELWCEDDTSSLYYTARALMKLQVMFGFFPHVRALGTKVNFDQPTRCIFLILIPPLPFVFSFLPGSISCRNVVAHAP